jgi:nucleotide-binding universal stress UspA family protein
MELLEAGTVMSSEECMAMPQAETAKRIRLANALLLTDFSSSSELALPYAVALARQYSGKVYVVHVISPEMYEYVPPELVPRISCSST